MPTSDPNAIEVRAPCAPPDRPMLGTHSLALFRKTTISRCRVLEHPRSQSSFQRSTRCCHSRASRLLEAHADYRPSTITITIITNSSSQ